MKTICPMNQRSSTTIQRMKFALKLISRTSELRTISRYASK